MSRLGLVLVVGSVALALSISPARAVADPVAAAEVRGSPGPTFIADACPNGWSPEETVWFAPPARPGRPGGIDSGVRNPTRANGCTLLDQIWNAQPFATHGRFVDTVVRESAAFVGEGLLTWPQAIAIVATAERSDVGKRSDHSIANSCPNRIALTFDDGPSGFRPETFAVLRDKQVHATFFDNGVRVEQNPQINAFLAREGHVQLNHTYSHLHMDEVPPGVNREEVLHNEAVLAAAGSPIAFKGIRPPFGGSNPNVQELLASMGYTSFLNRINAEDWLPDKSADQIRDDILAQLHPGVIAGLHDGPIDTPAGAATVSALGQIIDRARAMGYCFGVVDHTGEVVADRYVPSDRPIPRVTRAIPYHKPLAFGTADRIREPWVFIRTPLVLTVSHSPAVFVRGQGARLSLTVSNHGAKPTDGANVVVHDQVPSGLVATGAVGDGWTCTAGTTTMCTRTDVLPPSASYPAIGIDVSVAADAPATMTNDTDVLGHGETWTDSASDAIAVGP
ncbi:MAG TPA: polysaccharide deacetylase family protein [Polyangiaceae bacterium]|nr:polysaccharide deacetylase family protein [Polyangiaceae bacterium]